MTSSQKQSYARMILYSLLNFKALKLHIRTYYSVISSHNFNVNTFCKYNTLLQKLGLTLFEEKKTCRDMRRDKNILHSRFLEKKFLLTRNQVEPLHFLIKQRVAKSLELSIFLS